MSTSAFDLFFALLSMAAWTGALGVAVLGLTRRGPRGDGLRREAGALAMPLAWLVATVTTAGSLYYSKVVGYTPCELCWYQRIVMYPLVIVLGVAALRKDRAVWITGLVFVVIGAPLSLYHWLVERVPAFEESSSCSAITPCSTPYFEKLGFVTLAWMAMSSFLLIGVLLVCTLLGARDRADEMLPGTVPAMEDA